MPQVTWNCKKPPEPFPQSTGANGVFHDPSGLGKTTTLIAMLLGPYNGIFDQVHVFSPSLDIDNAWLPVRRFANHLMERSTCNWDWGESAFKVFDEQRNHIERT